MMRSMVIFACAAVLNKYAVLASGLLAGGLDFKDDAKEVNVRLDIVPPRQHLDFGEIDCAGYEMFLSRVSQMRHLRSLSIIFLNVPYDGFVFECERLAGLTNLNTLAISNYGTNSVRVSSMSVFKGMPLKELLLKYVDVGDVNIISEFKRLDDLYCTTEELFRCAPSGLRELYVEDAKFKGDVDLSRFGMIETLGLLNVKCASIQGLSSLTALKSLQLVGMSVKNLSDIKSCPRLNSLEISNCREFDGKFNVGDFKCLPLEELVLKNVPLNRIQDLENCPLKNLWIDGAEIESINDICRLPNLELLDVANTKIHFVDMDYVKEHFPKLESGILFYFDRENNIQCVEWD